MGQDPGQKYDLNTCLASLKKKRNVAVSIHVLQEKSSDVRKNAMKKSHKISIIKSIRDDCV